MRTLPILIAATLAASTPAAFAAEVEWLVDPTVAPTLVGGRKVGCDLSFQIAHGEAPPTAASAIAVSLGLHVRGDDDYALALKVGYQIGTGRLMAPEAAYLVLKDGSTEGEVAERRPADASGQLALTFTGERTRAAFTGLSQEGLVKIAFRPSGGSTRIWTLDLSTRKDVRDAFAKCLADINVDA